MIKCPECQKDVSETAKACPACGCSVERVLAKAEAKKAAEELLRLWRPASLYLGLLLLLGGCVASVYWFKFGDPMYANERYEKATTGGDAHYTLLAAQAAITVHRYAEEQQAQLSRTAAMSFALGAWVTWYGIKHRSKIFKPS